MSKVSVTREEGRKVKRSKKKRGWQGEEKMVS